MALRAIKIITIFIIGGMAYGLIELAFRGYTHISMFVAGGLSFSFMAFVNEYLSIRLPFVLQMLLSAIVITLIELIVGIIVNLNMNLHVWDYSMMAFNFKGQICLPFSIIWFFLSGLGIVIENKINTYLFNDY